MCEYYLVLKHLRYNNRHLMEYFYKNTIQFCDILAIIFYIIINMYILTNQKFIYRIFLYAYVPSLPRLAEFHLHRVFGQHIAHPLHHHY